jgi:tetratricopeptide (TPR) repeat protein
MQESASFWTDIKDLESRLAKSPGSFCFARLSEVYLKVGLVDDALHVARQGVKKHPRYLSGQRALSLACHAKGINDEARAALMLITEAMPEDVSSQKLLGRLLSEAGDQEAACQAFRRVLEFAPDDVESRIELEALERSAGIASSPVDSDDDEEIIEDLEILEETDVPEDEQPEPLVRLREVPAGSDIAAPLHHDPLSTGTLAELYVRQGFIHKALEIYRAILDDNPADQVTAGRVAELEELEAGAAEPDTEVDETVEEEAGDESAFGMPAEAFFQETGVAGVQEPSGTPAPERRQAYEEVSGEESGASSPPLKGRADNALAVLDGWLENIGRIKSCR